MANSFEQEIVPKQVHWYSMKKWSLNEWLIASSVLILVVAIVCYVWKDKTVLSLDYPIHFEKIGTFGDFIGGVIGTVLAYLNVRLLIKTIDLQNKANGQSEKSYVYVQQTENVKAVDTQFNSLLALYQKIVASMDFENAKGKDAFHLIALKILDKNQSLFYDEEGDEKAMLAFETQYANQRDKLAVYFRVVYRLLCLLKQADIDDKIRYNYAKMLRAQLTESELCLLRYNALTYNGKNMQDKILYFNLLKHLPSSKLYDLYPFYKSLNDDFKNQLDILLFSLRKKLEDVFINGSNLGEEVQVETKIPSFSLSYKVSNDRKNIEIVFKVNRRGGRHATVPEQPIVRYTNNQIVLFLKAYLQEVFSKSMFQIYTKVGELKFYKSHVQNGFCIKMILKSENGNRTLMITRKQLSRPISSLGPFVIGNHIISNN